MRLNTAVPTSVTVDNVSGGALRVAGYTLAAGATGVVLDLSLLQQRQPFGDPNATSRRELAWRQIALCARTDGPRTTALLNITATVPATLTPLLSAAVDYTGPRLAGVAAGTVYGKGPADTVTWPANTPRTAYGSVGAGQGPGAADSTLPPRP